MNPLTQVKRIQKINSTEAALGISEDASWHAKYRDSAYVFVGGIPFDLTEGDLLAVFAQCAHLIATLNKHNPIQIWIVDGNRLKNDRYGEVVDVNLVRDKATGKSKGFAFLAYEDQRSTILAVDNLNGAKVLGRIVRVDHVTKYKKKEDEDEEKEQEKREARGICRAYQKGECNRGAACKFSHNEQRSANTGWGPKDNSSRWDHDRYDGPPKSQKKLLQDADPDALKHRIKDGEFEDKSRDKGGRSSRLENEVYSNSQHKRSESSLKDWRRHGSEQILERKRTEREPQEDDDLQTMEKRTGRSKSEPNREDNQDRKSVHGRESSSRHQREEDRGRHRREHR